MALALISFPLITYAGVNIGVVLDVTGDWVLFEEGKAVGNIQKGQAVTEGSTARPRSDEGGIVILLNNDSVIKCEVGNLRECRQPLTLHGKPSRLGRFWASVSHFLFKPEFVGALTRAVGQDGPREAVLSLDGEQVDVGPSFKTMPPGRYSLRFVPLKPGATRKGHASVVFNWEPNAPSKISVPGLTQGLYRMLLLDEKKDNEPSSLEAWVLVSGVKQFQITSPKFREAQTWSEGWSTGAAQDAGRTFLRAYLSYLTQPGQK